MSYIRLEKVRNLWFRVYFVVFIYFWGLLWLFKEASFSLLTMLGLFYCFFWCFGLKKTFFYGSRFYSRHELLWTFNNCLKASALHCSCFSCFARVLFFVFGDIDDISYFWLLFFSISLGSKLHAFSWLISLRTSASVRLLCVQHNILNSLWVWIVRSSYKILKNKDLRLRMRIKTAFQTICKQIFIQ